MKNSIEDRIRQIESLIGEAAAVATRFNMRAVRASHLLFVIAGTEEGRRDIEAMRGNARRIRSFLETAFEQDSRPSMAAAGIEIDETIHRVVQTVIAAARAKNKPPSINALLREMTYLGDACMMTRQALIAGGIIDVMPHRNAGSDFLAAMRDMESSGTAEDEEETGTEGDADFIYTAPGVSGAEPEKTAKPKVDDGGDQSDEHMRAVLAATRDLTALARKGHLDEVIGMEKEISQVIDTISKKKKPNLLVSGEPGVGKTALAEALAGFLTTPQAPEALRDRPVLEVALSDLVAGARFRGDFEARMRALVSMAGKRQAILFMDEVHLMIGAGSVGGRSGMDASNILKPALARGEITVIGATTPDEMRELRRDGALMRRFDMMVLREPDKEKVRRIMDEAVAGYVMHHRVMVEDDMIDLAIDLADRYLPAQRFPDKAFNVIDQACVLAARRCAEKITPEDVRSAVERSGSVRLSAPDAGLRDRIGKLEERMSQRVFGQHEAVSAMARCARVSMLGLSQGGTAGAYLFNGPSGVGKTEMAYAFAAAMDYPLVRIDMSEFMEPHSVARLIGAPPGYVGFDRDGLLIEAADKYQDMVILFDEAEKAHPKIYDILLQMLDYGVVRSGDGRAVSFSRAHVILSANIGAAAAEKPAMGFGRQTDPVAEARDEIGKVFRKEMLARIPNRIQFGATTASVSEEIIRKELGLARQRYSDSGYEVQLDEALVALIRDMPQDDGVGGRGLQGRIMRKIHDPIATWFLNNPELRKVSATVRDGALFLS